MLRFLETINADETVRRLKGEVTPLGLKYKGDLPGLRDVEGKWVKDVLQITASAENGGTLSGGLRFKKN